LLLCLDQLAVACLELLLRLRLKLQRLRLAPESLLQLLLKIVAARVFSLGRLAGNRGLGFDLRLRGRCTPTHRILPAYESAGDRLGERPALGKGA